MVDRDYKSDNEIEVLRASCAVLDWHEAESYLCDPGLLSALAESLGTAEPIPTIDAIRAIIKEYVSERSLQICAKRIFSRLTHRIGVSARRRVCSALANYDDLKNIIRTEAQSELDKTGAIFDISRIDQIFEEEKQRCVSAVTSDNIDLLLTMAPGKELLDKLAPSVGCKNALAVVRAAKKHLDFNAYPKLLSLSQTLTTRLK